MSDPQDQVPVLIDPLGDVLIKVIKRGYQDYVKVLGYLKVSRHVLAENSDHFRAMLRGPFQEAGQEVVDVEDDTVASLEVWFRHFHGNMTDEMYDISIEEVWNILAVGRKRLLQHDRLNGWFAEFWRRRKSTFDVEGCKELLYPCFQFDHPAAFAYVTRKLAYEWAGHIEERNPTYHRNMYLPQRILGALNGAKGNLKTKLHEAVYINRTFLSKACNCKEKALFQFELALDKTGVWPMEQHMNGRYKKSLQQVLDGLKNFEYNAPENACYYCSSNFGSRIISPAIESVEKNFGGLCLDCVNNSRKGDENHKNWIHREQGYDWSENCRISHSQPTWYFSFLARRQQEDVFEQERLKRKDDKERAERESKNKEQREKAQATNGH